MKHPNASKNANRTAHTIVTGSTQLARRVVLAAAVAECAGAGGESPISFCWRGVGVPTPVGDDEQDVPSRVTYVPGGHGMHAGTTDPGGLPEGEYNNASFFIMELPWQFVRQFAAIVVFVEFETLMFSKNAKQMFAEGHSLNALGRSTPGTSGKHGGHQQPFDVSNWL